MKDRIKQYMDYKSISAGELSVQLDVQRSNISHILNGRNKPGALFIEKLLLSYPDLNARWLLTGDGTMIEVEIPKEKPNVTDIAAKAEKQEKQEKEVKEVVEEKKQDDNLSISKAISLAGNKSVEKVVLLYSDGTFKDFSK